MTGARSSATQRAATTPLLLATILAAGALALAAAPGADPPAGYGFEPLWLAGALPALDGARAAAGEVGAPAGDGGPWLVTLLAGALFRGAGVGLATARALPALATLLLALWAAATIRRRAGDAAGLLAAAAIIAGGASFALARSPALEPLASLAIALLATLAARRGCVAPWLALLLAPVLALVLHPAVLISAPALAAEALLRIPATRRFATGVPAAAVLLGAAASLAAWLALPAAARSEILAFATGNRAAGAGPPLLAVAPAALPFAFCGLLLFLTHAAPGRGPGRSLERVLSGVVWPPIALAAASGGATAPALASVLPFIAWLAVAAIARAGSAVRLRRLPLGGARGAFAGFAGTLGAAWLALEARALAAGPAPAGTAVALLASGVAILIGFGLPSSRRPGRPWVIAGAWLVLVLPGAGQCAAILGHPTRTIVRGSELVERQVLPTALLAGEWARAFTLGNDLGWAAERGGPGAERATHRLHAPAEPVPGLRLATYAIPAGRIAITRVEGAASGESAFERGRREESSGDALAARSHYYVVLHGDPRHAGAWERIGELLLAAGETENGYRCLVRAVVADPGAAAAWGSLARLHLAHDQRREALHHLRRAEAAGADGAELAAEIVAVPGDESGATPGPRRAAPP